MTDCTATEVSLRTWLRRNLQVDFSGGAIASDGGSAAVA
jgi:hypothetical protein